MLNAHTDLHIRFLETNLVRYYGSRFDPITDKANAAKLLDIIRNETIRNGAEFTVEQMGQIINYLDDNGYSYRNIYLALALFIFRMDGKKRWGEKYAGDCRDVEYFLDLFPDGQVIYIMRDPRDVYASNKKRSMSIENLESDRRDLMVIDEWKKCYCQASKHSKTYGDRTFLTIKYEELVKNPKKIAKRLCSFLRIQWQDAMIDPDKFVDDNNAKWEPNTYFEKFSGIDTLTISRYKKFLASEEIAFVEDYLDKELRVTGIKRSQEMLPAATYDTYLKKMRRGFLSAGKYRIALFVTSLDADNEPLARFLHQSYHDVTAFYYNIVPRRYYNYPTFLMRPGSAPNGNSLRHEAEKIQAAFAKEDFNFIHVNGPRLLDAETVIRLKRDFGLKIFLTNGREQDPQLILNSDKVVANSQMEAENYKSQGVEASKIILLDSGSVFDNMTDLYRSFVLEHKILSY